MPPHKLYKASGASILGLHLDNHLYSQWCTALYRDCFKRVYIYGFSGSDFVPADDMLCGDCIGIGI